MNDADGDELADLDEPGMRFVVAPGGQGGLGNASLANTKRKAPGFALLGTSGWEGDVLLELKTVADVALVGFPSAGKSSLVAALSAAKPKIADYPFTTLHPNLGVVESGESRYTIADVPGLIEGASEGKGLGLEFLRHVERCSALLHVLDCATLEPGRDPLSDLDVILGELAAYPVPEGQVPLLERPQLIALNKIDVPDARELAELVRPHLEERGYRVFEISAVSREGLRELSFALAELVEADRAAKLLAAEHKPRIVLRPRAVNEAEFTVRVEGGTEQHLPRPRRQAGALGAADRLHQRRGRRLPRRPAREARRRGRALQAGRRARVGRHDRRRATASSSTGSRRSPRPPSSSPRPRGTDARLDESRRPTREQRRAEYFERMDAKAAARAADAAERAGGFWDEDAGTDATDETATPVSSRVDESESNTTR